MTQGSQDQPSVRTKNPCVDRLRSLPYEIHAPSATSPVFGRTASEPAGFVPGLIVLCCSLEFNMANIGYKPRKRQAAVNVLTALVAVVIHRDGRSAVAFNDALT